jgi:hypothetical protein
MSTPVSGSVWANPLVRHLAVILAAKVLLLALLWWLFFRLPDGDLSRFADVHTHIAGPGPEAMSTLTD